MNIRVPIISAFVDGASGGNPAGVLLGSGQFSNAEKQAIAASVGLSEAAFVSESSVADLKLEFFTPIRQIDEEAATGMAAGPLACYLRDLVGYKQEAFEIEQGYMMREPSPSVIDVQLALSADGTIKGLMAGGNSKVMEVRQVNL